MIRLRLNEIRKPVQSSALGASGSNVSCLSSRACCDFLLLSSDGRLKYFMKLLFGAGSAQPAARTSSYTGSRTQAARAESLPVATLI